MNGAAAEEKSFYTPEELERLGFKYLGRDVLLSRKASYYGRAGMSFGDHSRVDDFTVISGDVSVGKYVHISNNATIIAGFEPVEIGDFATISFGARVFSKSDVFDGVNLLNPRVPEEFGHVIHAKVTLGRLVGVGANALILPGVHMADGSRLGAGSLLKKSTVYCGMYIGIPARRMSDVSDRMFELAEQVLKNDAH